MDDTACKITRYSHYYEHQAARTVGRPQRRAPRCCHHHARQLFSVLKSLNAIEFSDKALDPRPRWVLSGNTLPMSVLQRRWSVQGGKQPFPRALSDSCHWKDGLELNKAGMRGQGRTFEKRTLLQPWNAGAGCVLHVTPAAPLLCLGVAP